jgi:hypothetical protein
MKLNLDRKYFPLHVRKHVILDVKEVFYLSVHGDNRDERSEVGMVVVMYIPSEMYT